MPRYIAIYKGYDKTVGLQQGKDYHVISQKESDNQLKITVFLQNGAVAGTFSYAAEWEFLRDWQIIRSWAKKK